MLVEKAQIRTQVATGEYTSILPRACLFHSKAVALYEGFPVGQGCLGSSLVPPPALCYLPVPRARGPARQPSLSQGVRVRAQTAYARVSTRLSWRTAGRTAAW